MGNLILAGRDPDDVFAYNTAKLVRIRDRYLGLLHYLFQTLIFLYLLWNIYANQVRRRSVHPRHQMGFNLSDPPPELGGSLSRWLFCVNGMNCSALYRLQQPNGWHDAGAAGSFTTSGDRKPG